MLRRGSDSLGVTTVNIIAMHVLSAELILETVRKAEDATAAKNRARG